MKTLKILGLFALVIMNFTSCDLLFGHHEPEFVVYDLGLNFQDTSGNDFSLWVNIRIHINTRTIPKSPPRQSSR